ncbi:MAG: protein-L-isoaspartate(D-aspartate) O-methyltransferase [Gammaproteobacteria bacterium]
MTSLRTRERLVQRLREEGIRNPAVLDAIRNTPRHLFVDEALSSRAYEDTALPIGLGQTISQPYIVARMTEAVLEDGVPDKILEIGTGSGYQAAILAQLMPAVFSIERIAALLPKARQRMRLLELRNVRFKHSDGCAGWPSNAPYQAIMLTAAPEQIPPALFEQLALGGRMVAPLGPRGEQALMLFKRTPDGIEPTELERVSFVPLLGGLG